MAFCFAGPVEVNMKTDCDRDAVRPVDGDRVNVTVPVKPFRADTVIVALPLALGDRGPIAVVELTLKSFTTTCTVNESLMTEVEAVILIAYVPATSAVAVNVAVQLVTVALRVQGLGLVTDRDVEAPKPTAERLAVPTNRTD